MHASFDLLNPVETTVKDANVKTNNLFTVKLKEGINELELHLSIENYLHMVPELVDKLPVLQQIGILNRILEGLGGIQAGNIIIQQVDYDITNMRICIESQEGQDETITINP